MSQDISPDEVGLDDRAYVRQRPSLRQEFQMQGFGDPLDPDYEGLTDEARASLRGEDYDPEDESDSEEDESDDDSDDSEDDENPEGLNPSNEPNDLEPEKQWDDSMTASQLRTVINARNADYEDDEQIDVSESAKKGALIKALQQDDAELAEGEDDAEE